MRLKVAVIGTGAIARDFHIPHYKKLPDVELVAFCDINKERAKEVAQRFEVPNAYTDARQMLEKHQPDIVDVCTPNYAHCKATVDSLERGAHVICEKPMAMNVRECEKMIAAAKKNKRLLTVAFHYRFMPAMEHLKQMIEDGAIGKVYYSRGIYLRRSGIPGWGVFHIKEKSGGGPFIDIGVHVVDLLLWLMGNPKPVAVSGCAFQKFGRRRDVASAFWSVRARPSEFDVEDFSAGFIRLDSGALMSVETSWASFIGHDDDTTMILLGDRGGVTMSPLTVHTLVGGTHANITPAVTRKADPYFDEIEHFVECVKGNRKLRVTAEQALEVQRIADAVYESNKKGREIRLR